MKSFDDWYRQARDVTAEAGWKAGAQSRQSEVDELTGKLKNSEYLRDEHLEARRRLYKDNCELQKRIDDATDFLNSSNANDEYYVLQAIKILKGAANET